MKNFKYLLIMLIALATTVSCVDDDNMYVEPSPWVDVVDVTVNYTEGPLTSVTFPSNPIPGEDINVVLAYTSSEEILEARIYYGYGDAPEYVKANKVKGEDDGTFSQTGVTINLLDIAGTSGEKTKFYVRMATASGEYYYGNDGVMYLDNFIDIDQSDDMKDNPSKWNTFTVQ